MSLHRLLPNASKNIDEENLNNILYLCMAEWGWSWDDFRNTPLPVLLTLLKTHNKVQKERQRKQK